MCAIGVVAYHGCTRIVCVLLLSDDVPGHNGPCIDMFLGRGEWPWIGRYIPEVNNV